MMSTAVKVAVFTTQTEALIASDYLRANGIVATVMGDDAGGAFSGLVLSKGFKLYVQPSDGSLALELLESPPVPEESPDNT